jgi:L-cysteine desulfidase
LKHGIEVNLAAAEAGLAEDAGMKLGRTLQNMIHNGVLEGKLLNTVKMYAAAATDARMGGLKVPIIGLGGSGNHGITYFITVGMAAQVLGLPRDEKLDRALALGILIVRAIKYYTGVLTPMCGCAVAAGAGAAAAITYLLGGNEEQVVGSIKLLFGNLAGLVCDGAKYGCALKVGTSASVAVESALLSMDGVYISDSDGIIGCSLKETLHNLGVLHKKGMAHVDQTILDVILAKEDVRCEYETQR